MHRFLALAVVGLALLTARPADACTMPRNPPFEVRPGEVHPTVSVVEAVVSDVKLRRGQAGSFATGDCSNFSVLTFRATPTGAPAADIGYRIVLARGSRPGDLTLPDYPVVAHNGRIILWWNDNAMFQRSLDFDLVLVPVDRSGAEGTATAPIRVRDGWHVGWLLAGPLVIVVLFVSVKLARRRPRLPTGPDAEVSLPFRR